MPLFLFEVAPGLVPGAALSYAHATRWLAQHGVDCFDCEEMGRAGRGLPLDARLAQLEKTRYVFKGAQHGGYTNFVCRARKNR